jgi:FkbM family methyltransferase
MIVNRNDYRITNNGGYGVGYQLLQHSAFDQEEVNLAIQLLETRKNNFGPGVVALDCGANIGVHTVEWAQFMFGWGEVISIEAQERIFYALSGNISINNCFNARAIWAAVGSENKLIGVPLPDYTKPSSFGSLEIIKKENTEFIGQEIDYSNDMLHLTQMLRIDDLNMTRLDFIKLDIEGMELEALKGAEETIKITKPIMIVEKIKADEKMLTNFLMEKGYKIYPIGINLLAIHSSDPAANLIKAN